MRNDPYDPTIRSTTADESREEEVERNLEEEEEERENEIERLRRRHEEQLRNLEVVMSAVRAERNEREAREEMDRALARRNRGGRDGVRRRAGRQVGRSDRVMMGRVGSGRGQRSVSRGRRQGSGRGRGGGGDEEGLVGLNLSATTYV